MVRTILISKLITQGGFTFDPVAFPEAPVEGDYVNITSFTNSEGEQTLEQFLQSKNIDSSPHVTARTWSILDGELTLFVFLEFDEEAPTVKNPIKYRVR